MLFFYIIVFLYLSGIHYSVAYPFSDFTTGRCLRMSPIFPRLKAAGAVFGQVMGYERPSYFIHRSNGDSAGKIILGGVIS